MKWQTRLYLCAFCVYFTSASYTMVVPFLPIYLLHLGADENNVELWSAAVFAVCFFIAGTMAPIWGRLADKSGQKVMAARSAFLLCLTYASGGIVQTPVQLLLMRVLQGFANGYLPAVLSMISSTCPRERIGYSLGIMQSSQLIGTVSGPLIGGVLAHMLGIRASFFVAGGALLMIFLITLFMPNEKSKDERAAAKTGQRTSIIDDFKVAWHEPKLLELLIMFLGFNMVMVAIQPLLSLYVAQLAGGLENNVEILSGLACSLPPFVGALTAPFWGSMGQKKGFFITMSVAFLGSGAFIFMQGFVPNITMLMITSVGLGLFLVGIMPSMNALLALNTAPEFRGRGFGLMTMSGQYGAMFGPLLSGMIAHFLNLSTQFIISGSFLMLFAVYTYRRHQQVKAEGRINPD